MASAADRLKQYEDLFAQSQAYNPATFQSDFEKAYGEATNYNKDLIDSRASAIGQAQALPNQLREQYYSSPIRNPLAQESLISTRRGNITSDITGLTDLLTARGARYQDVLGKHLQAYQTDAQRAQTAAENAWRLYQDQLAQEEAARARAAAAAQAAQLQNLLNTQRTSPTGGAQPVYEIPVSDIQPLGNSYQDRLAQQVLNTRQASGVGDVLKSYFNTATEPLRNISSLKDVLNIPINTIAANTTIFSDLFNRLRR